MGYVRGYTIKKNLKKPYLAQISVNGRTQPLGGFKTAREAHAAYLEARKGIETARSREPHTPWTDEDKEELLRLFETTKLSYRKLGEALGRSELSIYHMLRRLRVGQ